MSYYNRYYDKTREPREVHEKAWLRAKATAWDEKWQDLSIFARRAYLLDVKAPTKEGSSTQSSILADKLPEAIAKELAAAGFVTVVPEQGKKGAKIVANPAAYDFSTRIRSMHRYHLLGPPDRDALVKSIKYAFSSQGEPVIHRVLNKAGIQDHCSLEEGLKHYVTTRRWPEWALLSCKSRLATPLYEALRKAKGPVKLTSLPARLGDAKPTEVREALTELVALLAAFEDIDPTTFELIVGLLPDVRDDQENADKPRERPPLVVCEHPKEVGPAGGLEVNDLRVFLLEIAGEAPRLRRDGEIFAKDEPRLLQALPPHPAWLEAALKSSTERRLSLTHSLALALQFVEREDDEKTSWLRLSGKGRNWLAAGFSEQYARVYEHYNKTSKKKSFDYDYNYSYGDANFLGVPVCVTNFDPKSTPYYSFYHDIKPEDRDALRASLFKIFQALPLGVFHRWDSVLDHATFEGHNPLLRGADPLQRSINIDRRQIPRLPEQVELAGKIVLDIFLRLRLLPLDAVRAGVDAEGKLCIARLPRLDGYFGRPYQSDDGESGTTRVIVQPDFSIVVIGLDPGPAAELAPFCERAGGQAGQGAMTFKITRDSVIRAASQGLSASAIVARLKKHASVEVPANILKEVTEWADWVRLVNVRPIMVIRCPDKQTVARVVSALGKKVERLSDTLVALPTPKLSSVERLKLQEHGILVTKDDIVITETVEPVGPSTASSSGSALPKKRGRPKKVR